MKEAGDRAAGGRLKMKEKGRDSAMKIRFGLLKSAQDAAAEMQVRSGTMPDYGRYELSPKEYGILTAEYLVLAGAVVWLFYDRWVLLIAALPGIIPWLKKMREKKAEERRKQLSYDFREALDSLAVSLKAGYSVENAFPSAARDLAAIIGSDAPMTKELFYIAKQSRLSVPVESLIMDFARRSKVEDIRNFAAVFTAAKRTGGNMPSIIRSAADSIGGRIDVAREIETSLAAKRMEQKIMTVMPCGIILYMRLASPGFLDMMYQTLAGAAVMTGCLLAYGAAVIWSIKIVDIVV